jgi:hypothetical protein
MFVLGNGPDLTPRDDIPIRDTAPIILRTGDGANGAALGTTRINSRLFSPARPLSPVLPGTKFSIRDHCPFVSSRRIKIASVKLRS